MMRRSRILARVGAAAVVATIAAPAWAARKPPAAPAASRIERLGRILTLEDARSTGQGALERLLRDGDRGVRRRAALAAGRLGDPALVPALVELMNDGEVEVRRMAAFALGLIGDRGAAPRLRGALADADAGVRGRAAEALGRIGDAASAPEIARIVVASLPNTIGRMTVRGDDPASPSDNWIEQRLALIALARLKDVASARQALLAGERPRFDYWVATWLAMRLVDPTLRPVLTAAATSDDARSRALAARGLGALKDASLVATLVSLARDREPAVAVEALRALAFVGDRRGTAAAAALLASPSDLLRHEALRALAVLPPDPSLRTPIVPTLGARDPWIRSAGFGALARTSPEDFTLVLSGLDPDPEFEVRAALAAALGSVADEMSVGVLHAMLEDPDPRVVAAVLEALRRARGANALDTLQRHLEHADLGVRAAAATQIASLAPKGLAGPLAAAWVRGLRDGPGEIEGRLAATDALARQTGEDAAAALRRIAAEDPSRPVRTRALAALRASAPDPGPEAVSRPPLDYREAMAPYDPRPGVPLYTPRVFLHTRKGTVEIQLDRLEAPLTAASFLTLAERGFYDGLTFHRLEPGFVVQGGCPRGDGNGGPGYTLRDEITRRPFLRGVVGLARSEKDSGGSQFFIALGPQPQLDGSYTAFGWVATGMDVVDALRPGDTIDRVEVWTGE